MEPTLPMPQSPEQTTGQAPVAPEATSVSRELAPQVVAPEQFGENVSSQTTATASVPVSLPPTQPQGLSGVSQSGQPVSDDSPIIADDVDVMEKEWVDKAKMIVNATKDDPHQQEKEVSKLQADYLMKRYNKKIKLTE